MANMLRIGETVRGVITNTTWTVKQFIGSGGQGEVYRVEDEQDEMALKWYLPDHATEQQKQTLLFLVERQAPSDRFLWPVDVVEKEQSTGFGYLMALREPRFKGLVDMMLRKAEPSFRALCTACFELAHHYMILHTRGLAYRDISFGNVFLDPTTGEIRICDNDNVSVNGQPVAGVAGTQRFMAPEIVLGQAQPSTSTDLFSLAVLLFYMLFLHHPLEGKREREIHSFDVPAMRRLYGERPLFIFDPNDRSNEPVPGFHDNAIIYWNIYPQFIRDIFTRAFTDGLHPDKRVRESEWRQTMVRLRDSIIYGPNGHENFFDSVKATRGEKHICWATKQPIELPLRLKIDSIDVCLTLQTDLMPYHLTRRGRDNYDFSSVLARVVRHPTNPAVIGLMNQSMHEWSFSGPDGALHTVEPGRSLTIQRGLIINFGETQGEIIG